MSRIGVECTAPGSWDTRMLLHRPLVGREAGVPQPAEDEVGVDVVAPRDLAHRHPGQPRLHADHPLLGVRPHPALASSTHPEVPIGSIIS